MSKFLTLLWIAFFQLLPRPKPFDWLTAPEGVRPPFQSYRSWYHTREETISAFYKDQLYRIDQTYRLNEDAKELVVRRNKAREQGVDPMSNDYPDLHSVRNHRLHQG